MGKEIDGTKVAPHGIFHMEDAGGSDGEGAVVFTAPTEEHQPSCFGLEEERGEGWHGSGAMKPAIRDMRPTL